MKFACSEEVPEPVDLQGDGFSVAFDPLDGSSIVDTNFTVGTIFGIWPGNKLTGVTGRDQVRPQATPLDSLCKPPAFVLTPFRTEEPACLARPLHCAVGQAFLTTMQIMNRMYKLMRAGGGWHGHLRPKDNLLHRPEGRPGLPRVCASGRRQVGAHQGDHRDWCAKLYTSFALLACTLPRVIIISLTQSDVHGKSLLYISGHLLCNTRTKGLPPELVMLHCMREAK